MIEREFELKHGDSVIGDRHWDGRQDYLKYRRIDARVDVMQCSLCACYPWFDIFSSRSIVC